MRTTEQLRQVASPERIRHYRMHPVRGHLPSVLKAAKRPALDFLSLRLDLSAAGVPAGDPSVHAEGRRDRGFVAVYAQLRPTPQAAIAVSTEQPVAGDPTNLRFFPTNLNGFDPGTLHFSWVIKDDSTGQVISAPPYPLVAVTASTDAFATTDTNFGPGKVADAILTVTQPGIQVTAQTTFEWRPPTLPPRGICPGTGPTIGPINFIRAALNNGGGGGAPGCP